MAGLPSEVVLIVLKYTVSVFTFKPFCQRQMRYSVSDKDENLVFSNLLVIHTLSETEITQFLQFG